MKAIVNTGPGQLQWLDLPRPEPGDGQVRVRTAAVGICATDLEMIRGWQRTGFPATPGHEWSGHVDAVGAGVDPCLLGQPCVADNVLADGGEVGFEHPGGYGQFFLTEAANIRTLPAGFPLTLAVLIEPLAVVVRGLKRLQIGGGAAGPVLVIGDGPIGLLSVMVLKQRGIGPITILGGRPGRLAVARRLGAQQTLSYRELGADLSQAMQRRPGRFLTIIEASGKSAGMHAGLAVAERGARVLVLGDYAEALADFPWNDLLHRELALIGSNASAGAWDEAVDLAANGALPLGDMVSQRFPAERFEEGMTLVSGRTDGVIKVVLEWE